MKYTFFGKIQLLFALGLMVCMGTGCIHEDLDACYQVVVKVVNIKGEDITASGDGGSATLFVFDESGRYLEQVAVSEEAVKSYAPVSLNYPADRKLQVVVWSNLDMQKQTLPQLTAANTVKDLQVMIKNENGNAVNPDQLFAGTRDIVTKSGAFTTDTVIIQEKVSRVMVQTLGFEYVRNHETKADDLNGYSFYVKRTPGAFDFEGTPVENTEVTYNPAKGVTETGELSTPYGNVAPAQAVVAEFTRPDGSVDQRDVDDNGAPFIAPVGQELVITFVYGVDGALIHCTSEVRPWGTGDDQHIKF